MTFPISQLDLCNRGRTFRTALATMFAVVALTTTPAIIFAQTSKPPQQERNVSAVKAFYKAALNHKDFATAPQYLGSQLIQRDPRAEDGPEGFAKVMAFLKTKYPESHWDVKQVFSDGNFVIMHALEKLNPEDRGNAVIDIFRLENGKIVEQWDIVQPIPETSANRNTMF